MDRDPVDPHVTVTVAVVEDQPVTVDGVRAWLDRDPLGRGRVVAAGDSIEATLAAGGEGADVLLLDLDLHGRLVTDRIAGLCAGGHRVVVFSALTDSATVHAVHVAGASGFLVKDTPAAELADAVRRIAAGLRVVDPALAVESLMVGDSPLTEREQAVLLAAADGGTVADIARSTFLGEGTVRNYLSAAMGKTGARNRADAVRIARHNGWLLGGSGLP